MSQVVKKFNCLRYSSPADAPMYWNESIDITSMTGQTTRVSSSTTRSISGGSQSSLHSQWLSRKVRIFALAISAPRTLDRTRPSRFSFLITRTLLIFASSRPSSAAIKSFVQHLMTPAITRKLVLRWSEKSSTKIISLIKCSGLRLRTLKQSDSH
jgi:hypothetical protein